MHNTPLIPAPWQLEGEGYILLYKFNRSDISAMAFMGDALKARFAGGLGALMLIDYKKSDVGPYSELLFIPGRFKTGKWKRHNIPKIYVSTQASVVNGIANWAIPKEQADFTFTQAGKNTTHIEVSTQSTPFFSITIKEKCFAFPIHTTLLPFPLLQEKDGKYYLTKFTGKGKGKFVSISDLKINPDFFPDITYKKPLVAMRVSPFSLCFPKAEIIDMGV